MSAEQVPSSASKRSSLFWLGFAFWFRLAAGSLVLSLAFLGQAMAASMECLLPQHVQLAVITHDLAATSRSIENTELGRLLCGEKFLPLRRAAATADHATLLYLRPWFGFDWADLSQSNNAAAFVVFPVSRTEVGSAWIFVAGDGGVLQDGPLKSGSDYFRAKGFVASDEAFVGGTIVSFRSPVKGPASYRPAYLSAKSVLIAASSAQAAMLLYQSLPAQESQSLAALKEYRETFGDRPKTTGGPNGPCVRLWMRPLELWASLRGKDAQPSGRDWLAIARQQGGSALRAAGADISVLGAGPVDIEIQGNVLAARPLTKAARMLDFRPVANRALPDWLMSDVAEVSTWAWDVPDATKALGSLFDAVGEPGGPTEGLFQELLNALRDDPEGPKVDLAGNLFPHLGPNVLRTADRLGPRTAENPHGRRVLMVIQCRDIAAVTKTLAQFYKGDETVSCKKIGDWPFWSVGEGRSLFVESTGGPFVDVRGVLVTDKELLAASDPAMLESRFHATTGEKLSASRSHAAVAGWWQAHDDPKTCFRSLIQLSPFFEGPYESVREGRKSDSRDWQTALMGAVLTGSAERSSGSMLRAIPQFGAIRDSLPDAGIAVSVLPSGWSIRLATLPKSFKAH